ncbi:MAG: GAF domain-containing protein [Chloroflexia bacterium]|nr:GAF domain-containing protein [Chloroflexia bacterium]
MIALIERKRQLYQLIGLTAVVAAFVALVAIHLPGTVEIHFPALYALVALTMSAGVALLLFSSSVASRPAVFWPIAGGVFPLFEAIAVYFTGGVRSPFFVLFYFSLFFIGMVGGQRGAALGSIVIGVLYLAACVAHEGGIDPDALMAFVITICSFYGIAGFAAYLGNVAWQEARDASRRAMRIVGLNAVNNNLSETLDMADLLATIPSELCHRLGFERALVYTVEESALHLQGAYSTSDPTRLAELVAYLHTHPPELNSNTVEAEAARLRRPVVSTRVHENPEMHPTAMAMAPTQCFAAAPMLAQDRLIGVVVADYYRSRRAITEEELILLETFAGTAALAVVNNELHADASRAEVFRQLDTLKSEFLGTVSHELRTPLTLVRASTELLLDSASDGLTASQMRLVETTGRNVVRLQAFVEELLEMAQLEEGQVQPNLQLTDLRYLVDEVARTLQLMVAEKAQTLYLDVPDDQCLAEVDRHRIQQVVTNLVTNACKYTPQGGKVWVRVCPMEDDLSVEVQDNGPGIPSQSLEHVFDKFYRVPGAEHKAKGAGLGLAITRSIVELHGGKITAESPPNQGARFRFVLRRAPELSVARPASITETRQ